MRPVNEPAHFGSRHCCECANFCHHIGPVLLCAAHEKSGALSEVSMNVPINATNTALPLNTFPLNSSATTTALPWTVDFGRCRTSGILGCRNECCRPDLHVFSPESRIFRGTVSL